MPDFMSLLVVDNIPVLVAVFAAALFARIGSGLGAIIFGLIVGLAAFAGMTFYGMEHVTPLLGGGGGA